MKRTLLGLLLINCFTMCYAHGAHNNDSTRLPIDTNVITIMPGNYLNSFFKNAKPATLTARDCPVIEKLLNQSVKEYHERWQKRGYKELYKGQFIIDLAQSKRQYVVVTDEKGEKEVYINCFNASFEDEEAKNWHTQFVMVKGGGPNFFRIKINLATKTYYEMRVNGDE